MKEHVHSRIAKILVVLALAVVASVMFVFVGCDKDCAHENTHQETIATATCTSEGTVQTICDDCGEVIKTEHPAALGHDWDEGTVVAATCTSGGYTLQTCSRCEATRQINPTDALEHQWKDTTVVAATCTSGGYTLQTCEACGATRQVNPTDAKGHTWETISQAATCGEAGYTAEKCSVCGAIQGMQTIPATGNHTWVAGKTVAATCVTDGYTEYTCSVCGATKQEITEKATGHKWVNDKVLVEEATCTENGYYYLECANCDERQTLDVIAPLGHAYSWSVASAYSCTTDGSIKGTCTRCKATVTYTADQYAAMSAAEQAALKVPAELIAANSSANGFLQASGHNYISVLNKNGYADTAHKYDTPSAGGHDDKLYHVCQDIGILNADTENEVDYTGYSLVCTECNVKVATKDHTPDADPAYACVDKDGDGVAWTCEVCGYEQAVEEHTVVLKGQDKDGKWTVDAPADAVFSCIYAQVCDVCGTVINADGPHTKPDANNPAHADYVANCQHGNLCVTCGKDVYGGKLAHSLVELKTGEVANGYTPAAATCTATGLKVYACEMCMALEEKGVEINWVAQTSLETSSFEGNYYTEVISKLPHNYVTEKFSFNEDDPKAELCTTDYYKKDVCSVCGDVRIEVKPADSQAENAPSGKEWTNEQGLYGYTEGHDAHDLALITDKDYYLNADGSKKDGMGQFALPNCSADGMLISKCQCDGCIFYTWETVTLEQYAEAAETTVEKLLKQADFHAGTMPACGHPVCDVCEPDETAIHTAQYILTFQVIADASVPEGATLPTYEKFIGWSCYEEATDVARLVAYIGTVDKGAYTIEFYQKYDAETGVFSNEITDWSDLLILEGEDTYRKNTTIYVKASIDEAVANNDGSAAGSWIFLTSYNTTARWVNENVSPNRSQYLDVELCIDTDVIAPEAIDSISVTLKNADGAAVATAVCNTEAQLANFVNSCNTIWAKNGNQQWIQIEEFCNKVVTEATPNFDGAFMVTNSVAYGTCLDGYTLEVKMVAGGVTFNRTITIANTQEQIMENGSLVVKDIDA